MITLITTLVSFLAGGLPKLLGFFQDRADKSHEMAMARLQTERELELRKAGFEAQQRVEEIRVEGQMIEAASAERSALYAHDIAIGKGASQWMINLRASVRPVVTYIFVLELVALNVAGVWYAWHQGVPFAIAMENVFSDDEMAILASIIAFHFGGRAFGK